MTTDLAIYEQPLGDQWKYAQALAQAATLPKAYRERPGDILLAFAYGQSLGILPAQVFTGIDIIDGKPSMSAELMGALVRRAGHKLRMSGDKNSATVEIVRRDDPEFTYRATFDIEDARNAGLLTKENWRKYPAAMLLARALSACARQAAGDVLAGVSYVPDELGAMTIDALPEQDNLRRIMPAGRWEDEGAVEDKPAEVVVELPAEEPPKRRRRTKAEMEEARRAELAAQEAELAERMASNKARLAEADLAGPSDPEGEQRQETAVAEANEDAWVNEWLVDLGRAIEERDLGAVGSLGSKAADGNRRDLVAKAREAWAEIQGASA